MPNLKYLNINGVNYSLGRDTKIYYGSTSETITDAQEGDLLIDLVGTPQAGKNLCPEIQTQTVGTTVFTKQSDGSVMISGTASSNDVWSSNLIFSLPAGEYILNGGVDNNYKVRVGKETGGSVFIGQSSGNDVSFTLTETTELFVACRIQNLNGQSVSALLKPMIRKSTDSASYEQYKGNTYTISLENEAGTVYGGTLDVVSGQLTVNYKSLVFDGTQAVTDRISSQNRVYYQISDMATGSFYSDNNVMCNRLEKVASVSNLESTPPGIVIGYSNNYVYIQGVKNIGGANITDLASFNTWVSDNNIVITYPLATPLTYQLTPTQVALLRGDSKIWSDSGDTSVIYTNINDTTSTASGSIVNIIEAKKGSAYSVIANITPQQDLNGYDNPWAGGAGKNLLLNTATTQTRNGVTFTFNTDGSVKVNGTATSNAAVVLCDMKDFLTEAGTYTLSGCPSGGGNGKYKIECRVNSSSSWYGDEGNGVQINYVVNQNINQIRIIVYSGFTANNLIFYPMLEKGSTKTAFAPYENICPITGYNNINITKINPLYDTSETGTKIYKYGGANWTEIMLSGGIGSLSNLKDGVTSGSIRGINTDSEDGTYVMGQNAVAVGGSTQAAGANSFTSGLGTVAQRGSQVVFGEYNSLDTTGSTSTRGDYAFIIGNGTSNVRSNATTVDWEGSIDTHGAITAGSIDNGYGLNDQALLASDTIALWEDIING